MLNITSEDGIRFVEFSHGKVNALDLEFCREISKALSEAATDECRGVIYSGNGRVFSAGVDLKRLINEDLEYLELFLDELESVFEKAFFFPKPLVANVNGHAVAGGCVLACASDARIAHRHAKIGVPELRVGVPFPSLGLEIMRFSTAPQFFRQMINIGATYSDDRAVAAGLVDEIVDVDQMRGRCIDIINEMIRVPSEVFELTKNQLRIPAATNIARSEKQYRELIRALWRSDEIRDVVRGYVETTLK